MLLPQIPGFTIRPIRLEDAEDWASYACLPEVKEHTSSTAATADDVRAVIQRTLAGEQGSPIHFVLLPEGRQTIVGTVGFHHFNAQRHGRNHLRRCAGSLGLGHCDCCLQGRHSLGIRRQGLAQGAGDNGRAPCSITAGAGELWLPA